VPFLWWFPRKFSFARCSALESLSARQVVTVTWDPHPRAPVLEGASPGGGLASPSHYLALRWFQSHVGRRESAAGVLEAPDRWFSNPFLVAIRGGTAVWLLLLNHVEVWDIGACVVRLWSHVVTPVFLVVLLPLVGVLAALAGNGLVIPTEPCSRVLPPYSLQVASFPAGSECVAAIAGGLCYERRCCFDRATVGFVIGLHIRVGASRRLREPTCGVGFIGAGLWSAEPVEVHRLAIVFWWCFPELFVVVLLVATALPSRLSCCATSGLRYAAVVLAVAFWLLGVVVLSHGIWCHVAHCGDLCGEGPSPCVVLRAACLMFSVRRHQFSVVWLAWASIVPVCVSPVLQLCLQALVAVWCVALSACVGSGPVWPVLPFVACGFLWAAFGRALVHCVALWVVPGACVSTVCCVVFPDRELYALFRELLGVQGGELSTSGTLYVGRALWLYRYRCGVAALPCLGSPIGGTPLWLGRVGEHWEVVVRLSGPFAPVVFSDRVPVATVIPVSTTRCVVFLSHPVNVSRHGSAFGLLAGVCHMSGW
ncbi:hypothetical protein Taro_024212, partial [Colocasia esculenta]|nr:hypothetical protein [Colocasia esculenta]